ncbi:unnamed protein product [Moneuplotes crassus]|uniref:Condensin complex subunit 1 n=1 Tax=Euplotes crassus TaxID=5936 RepID=A0AAD1XAX8_EUPCR|nr:unnamed protein product [Moneuplotes crassus]
MDADLAMNQDDDMSEFIFPIKREQMTFEPTDGRIYVHELLEIQGANKEERYDFITNLSSAIGRKESIHKVLDPENYDMLFSFVHFSNKCNTDEKASVLDIITRCLSNLQKLIKGPLERFEEVRNSENFDTYRNVLKCLTFLIHVFVEEASQSSTSKSDLQRVKGNRQRRKAKDDSVNFLAAINKINLLLDCDLHYLWKKTRKVEADFIKCLFDIGFNLLENSKAFKNNTDLKEEVFQFLQKIISKYSKELSGALTQISARIISVMYKIEEIAEPLAEFVIVYTQNENDSTLATSILDELLTAVFNSDSSHESIGIKNNSIFLSKLSSSLSQTMFSSLSKLLGLLDCEAYQLRIAFVNIMTNFIVEILTNNINEIEDAELRTNYQKTKEKLLKILLRRVFDKTSFVRKEVLNCFKLMVVKNNIEPYFYSELIAMNLGRMKDQSINVRKAAMSLFEEIIKIKAIFYEINEKDGVGFDNIKKIDENILSIAKIVSEHKTSTDKLKDDIKALRIEFCNKYPEESKEAINEKLKADEKFIELKEKYDSVQKQKALNEDFIEFYEGYKELILSLESSVPLLTQLLGSPHSSDVIESIKILTYLQKMKIEKAVEGTKKILVLFFNKDNQVKDEALNAYKILYLDDKLNLTNRAFALIELLKDADSSEEACVEEFLTCAVRKKVISNDIYKALWKIFTECSSTIVEKKNGCAALKILRIATEHHQNCLESQEDTLKERTINELKSSNADFILISEMIKSWEKINTLRKQRNEREVDDFILKLMIQIIKQFGTEDVEWNCAAEQFLNSLFELKDLKAYKKAELFVHSLIKKISLDHEPEIERIEEELYQREDIEIDETLFNSNLNFSQFMLAQLLFVAGHMGIKMIIYIENVEKLLEKRAERKKQKKKEDRKDNDEDQEEELDIIAGGDDKELDNDLKYLRTLQEEKLLQRNLLSKFVKVTDKIIEHIYQKYKDVTEKKTASFLERVSVLTLCKFMLVSGQYCESRIKMLFKLLMLQNLDPKIKSNILICIGDLHKRHPNIVKLHQDDFFKNLSSPNSYVKKNCLRVISHLILNDMILIKGEISDICALLNDPDEKIRDLVKLFLHELHSKNNDKIYNTISEAINNLAEKQMFTAEDSEKVVDILIKYIQKDKQIETLLDNLCAKMGNSMGQEKMNEVRITSYTISILNLSEKHLPRLMDHYDKYKAWIQKDEYVRNCFLNIPPKFKKNNEIRDLIDMMETKFTLDSSSHLPTSNETNEIKQRFNQELKKRRGGRRRNQSPLQNMETNIENHSGQMEVDSAISSPSNIKRKRRHNEIST